MLLLQLVSAHSPGKIKQFIKSIKIMSDWRCKTADESGDEYGMEIIGKNEIKAGMDVIIAN